MHESYRKWIEDNKPKIFCQCHCHQEIIIRKRPHSWYGIPKYIHGHNIVIEETRSKMIAWQSKRPPISEEQKIKTSNTLMGHKCLQETKDKISKSLTGRKQSKEIIEKRRPKISGENHWNYQNGKSFEPYCPKFNNQKKEEIRNQYGRKCYYCNKDEKDNIIKDNKIRKLCVHHIDGDKKQGCNGKPWKLVPLCLSCHMKLHNVALL